ncbi:hypothetical protein Tco_0110170 [Tanacetum coccineum]
MSPGKLCLNVDKSTYKDSFPSDMSLGKLSSYVDKSTFRLFPGDLSLGILIINSALMGPTSSPGIIAGDCIPDEVSPARIPQRHVAGETYPQ